MEPMTRASSPAGDRSTRVYKQSWRLQGIAHFLVKLQQTDAADRPVAAGVLLQIVIHIERLVRPVKAADANMDNARGDGAAIAPLTNCTARRPMRNAASPLARIRARRNRRIARLLGLLTK